MKCLNYNRRGKDEMYESWFADMFGSNSKNLISFFKAIIIDETHSFGHYFECLSEFHLIMVIPFTLLLFFDHINRHL